MLYSLTLTYIIQREALRCSFYSDGQMPEPRFVERVTDTDSHALFLYGCLAKDQKTKSRFFIQYRNLIQRYINFIEQ